MRLSLRLAINLLAVLMLGIVTVGWVVSNVLGNGLLNPPFEVTADFASSGGVFTNQEVTYRGVVIGKVGDLELNDDGVDVSLLIDQEWNDKIPSDVVANIQNKSAVGEQFVNLTPLSDDGPKLTDESTIPRERTELPVDFQALLRSLDAVLADLPPEQVERLVTNLADGIGGRGEDIASILRSLRDLSVAFAEAAPEGARLLDNATRAGAEFLRTKDEFAAAIQASDDVLEGLGDEPEELAALFRANDRIARNGSALLAKHGDNLADGIDALADFTEFQNENKDAVIQSLEYVPQFLNAVEEASIPWQNPDGSRFYRIRVGLVYDNVRSSWPCKYDNRPEYERFPHIREARRPYTATECRDETEEETSARVRELIAALESWLADRGELERITYSVTTGIGAAIAAPISSLGSPTPGPTATPTSSPSPEASSSP